MKDKDSISQAEKFERWVLEAPVKPPCVVACPVNADIQSYVSLVGQGRFKEALETVRERCTLPGSLGRICNHPCEGECRRNKVDSAVSIRSIKRFAADVCMDLPHPDPIPKTKGKRVAIIGGGPSGLTAAYDLAKDGFDVTIFEKNDACGGAIYTGVPKYRLPKDIVAWDVAAIQSLGVEIKTNTEIGKDIAFSDLIKDYDAVLIAIGLSVSRSLPIPGADAQGVLLALPFLKMVNFDDNATIGRRVIVIGGGNVATDVARSARRIGAEEVKMFCLESDEEMPASPWEIEESIDEGIQIYPSWGPKEIKVKDGKVAGMVFKKCLSVFENGMFNPKFDECELTETEADNVIFAIGQGADTSGFTGTELAIDERGRIAFNPMTMQTNVEGVFACGEVVTGPGAAVAAMKSGHRAATAIAKYLDTGKVSALHISEPKAIGQMPGEVAEIVTKLPRTAAELADAKERIKNFNEVEFGFDQKTAMYEARRCMNCGAGAQLIEEKCAACLTCVRVCPYGAPYVREARVANFALENCQACGICAAECPALAIDIKLNESTGIMTRASRSLDEPFITVFTCQYSVPEVLNPERLRTQVPAGVNQVSMLCNNRIDTAHILAAFEAGADGVLVAACPDEKCRHNKGIDWPKIRVARVKDTLNEIGLGADRLELAKVTKGSADDLTRAVNEFKDKIEELGPSPLSKQLTPSK
ncbi:MAG: FAD-dependent oxidoreductase [Firmicutes bacterium]|nr:FAD-dependent oxidoreductase [Bacillota bacterium]